MSNSFDFRIVAVLIFFQFGFLLVSFCVMVFGWFYITFLVFGCCFFCTLTWSNCHLPIPVSFVCKSTVQLYLKFVFRGTGHFSVFVACWHDFSFLQFRSRVYRLLCSVACLGSCGTGNHDGFGIGLYFHTVVLYCWKSIKWLFWIHPWIFWCDLKALGLVGIALHWFDEVSTMEDQ